MKLNDTQKTEKARKDLQGRNARLLVGKIVRYMVPMHDLKARAHPPGQYLGRVLSVVAGPRMGFRSCKVARPSNPDGTTLKQRFDAEPVRVYAEWIIGVRHRSIKTLEEYLGA